MKTVIIDGIEYAPVKKQEEVRKPREWWVNAYTDGIPVAYRTPNEARQFANTNEPQVEIIHVIEVLPGSIQVSKEQLAKAWDGIQSVELANSSISIGFQKFCKALGFTE